MLHILTALPCEAQPIKAHYRLSRLMSEQAFDIYHRNDLSLTVSGVGKTAMAAAVAYTFVLFGKKEYSAWLNLGVAGHATHALGRAFVTDRIVDDEKELNWYPPLVYRPPCPTESLRTVSKPNFDYRSADLYDMEGASFYQTATRFTSGELVQCLKIISDNKQSPRAPIKKSFVAELIEHRIDLVDAVLNAQRELMGVVDPIDPSLFQAIIKRWKFSREQQRQLNVLLNKWELLSADQPLDLSVHSSSKSAKYILRWLRDQVDNLPVTLNDLD